MRQTKSVEISRETWKWFRHWLIQSGLEWNSSECYGDVLVTVSVDDFWEFTINAVLDDIYNK